MNQQAGILLMGKKRSFRRFLSIYLRLVDQGQIPDRMSVLVKMETAKIDNKHLPIKQFLGVQ